MDNVNWTDGSSTDHQICYNTTWTSLRPVALLWLFCLFGTIASDGYFITSIISQIKRSTFSNDIGFRMSLLAGIPFTFFFLLFSLFLVFPNKLRISTSGIAQRELGRWIEVPWFDLIGFKLGPFPNSRRATPVITVMKSNRGNKPQLTLVPEAYGVEPRFLLQLLKTRLDREKASAAKKNVSWPEVCVEDNL